MASLTTSAKIPGGGFLLTRQTPADVFTPEDLSEEHRAIARTVDDYWRQEVEPHLEEVQRMEPGVAVGLLRKAAQIGLTGIALPERYGGLEMDLASLALVAECMGRDGSFSAWFGAHTGIGTMPLLLFGTEEQKQRYLPRLASAELIAAYCLSEPHAGSDALAARTRADLAEDGTHYVLNGQKMWITNGGAADLYTVFAKVGGEQFTAFLVERAWPGVTPGAEEKKMGIKGSSTTAIYFDNVKVPVENVLGEIGRGHIIAFNILNLGRLKLGPFAVGAAKHVLAASLRYAAERKAFGKTIGEFGMIRQKLAEMAIRTFAAESICWRVIGLIESQLDGFSWEQPDAAQAELKAVEEYAAECSFVKVFASEVLDYVVDEGVQIHGGYGFHQDYLVERAYRDSRINRIFEGTNEINRLLATGMLLKRAKRGRLPLVAAVMALQKELLAGPVLGETAPQGPLEAEARLVENAKKIGLLLMGVAFERFGEALENEQEVLAGIADILMAAFAMESALLRARKLAGAGRGDTAAAMVAVWCREALEGVEQTARQVLAGCAEGDSLRTNLAVLRRFTKFDPVNAIAIRRSLAAKLLQAGRYTLD
jgi:alkylation response protein AidB-like acyl-CoA dehydrogenase